jgi:hypothetical protein
MNHIMNRQAFVDANGVFDAQAAYPFVVAQGRNIETRIYSRRYPAFEYAPVVPVVTEGNAWAIGTTFFTVDVTGEAKFLSGAGTDMPFNSAIRDQASHDFAMIGSGWEWNIEEINQGALYGVPLNDTKAMSASQNIERLLYNIAMTGSTEKNWKGFANYTGVSRVDVANDGTGTSTFWSTKTPAQILRDMHLAVWTVRLQSNDVEIADTLALPPEAMQYVTITYVGTEGTSPTILERFKATHPGVSVIEVPALKTASNDGGGRMVAYRRDPEVLRFHLPMPRQVLQPRQKAIMGFETGIIARTGGTEVRLPGAMAYLDEVTAPPA